MLQVTWDLKTWVDSPALLFTGIFFYIFGLYVLYDYTWPLRRIVLIILSAFSAVTFYYLYSESTKLFILRAELPKKSIQVGLALILLGYFALKIAYGLTVALTSEFKEW
jgi:hypothetical protein